MNKKREGQRQALRAGFEEQVARAKEEWVASKGVEDWKQNERFMRREFELKREMELVEHGEGSVWFEYTV